MRVKYCLVCLSIERTGEATIGVSSPTSLPQLVAGELVDSRIGTTGDAEVFQVVIEVLDPDGVRTSPRSKLKLGPQGFLPIRHDRHVVAIEDPADVLRDRLAIEDRAIHFPRALQLVMIFRDGRGGFAGLALRCR
jgi:hypothetical protein